MDSHNKPVVYLLCGLPGSGKTSYADNLVNEKGLTKISIDDELISRFGVVGSDYPCEQHRENKKEVMKNVKEQTANHVRSGISLVLDFGVWRKSDRDYFRSLVEENGGKLKLVYFKANKDLLIKRLKIRNVKENGAQMSVDESGLDVAFAVFEEPSGESEIILEQNA